MPSQLSDSTATIRSATPEDRAAIVQLLTTVGLPHDDLCTEMLPHFCVLRTDDGLRGVVGLEPTGRSALLRSLAVHPSIQGDGHGTALVAAAEAHGQSEGVDTLYLLTTTAPEFFRGLGYTPISRQDVPRPVAETDEFARLCPNTATCMQKSLIS